MGSTGTEDMFDGADAMDSAFDGTSGYDDTPTSDFFNYRYPCFIEGTLIETDKGLVPVEKLCEGDMVKTIYHGYKAVDVVGTRLMSHYALSDRVKDQLYICKKEKFPEATHNLVLRGCHSVLLMRGFHDKEEEDWVSQINDGIYVTDGILRFPACVLEGEEDYTTDIYQTKGTYNIYHFALEHDNYYMNYGVYANNILVESSSLRYMHEESQMRFINQKIKVTDEEPQTMKVIDVDATIRPIQA